MKKIKAFFQIIQINTKKTIEQYTATNIVIILTTIILMIIDYELLKNVTNLIIIAVLCAVNFFVVETYFKKIWQRLAGYTAGIIVAIIIQKITENMQEPLTTARILIGYISIIFLIGLIKIVKDSKLEFYEYITHLFKNLFNTFVVYAILNIGLTVITQILIYLLIPNKYELLVRLQIALFGIYLMPAIIVALTREKTEITKYGESIIRFVLLPLIVIATAIIYIYMAKILILKQIPSNEIYKICAGLFQISFFVWIMSYMFNDKSKVIKKSCTIMPMTFIPFIALQIYSLYKRCNENGITPTRYMGIIFIIFEVFAIILYLIKQRKYLKYIIHISIILILISTIMPVINLETASNINQANRLKTVLPEGKEIGQLTQDEKAKAKSAYRYLKESNSREKYIPQYIKTAKLDSELGDDYYSNNSYRTFNYSDEKESVVDVQGYNRIKTIKLYLSKLNVEDLKNTRLDNTFTIDMRNYIEKLITLNNSSKEVAENYMINNRTLKIKDDRDFRITSIYINYPDDDDENLNEIEYISIEGYMLIK